MILISFFLLELIILYFLSRLLSKYLSFLLFRICKNRKITVFILSFLFLPGILIHELSHFFTAILLFVKVGDIELIPQVRGEEVKLGSVQVAKTDPVRRFVIGASPIIIGITIILASLSYFSSQLSSWSLAELFSKASLWKTLLLFYILFEVGNTMFSSKKDTEGALELFLTIGIIGGVLYFFGFRLPEWFVNYFSSQAVTHLFQKAAIFLLAPVGIDAVGVLVLKKVSLIARQ